jgi:FtsZ-interacting cell division protein ZipA
VFDVMLDIAKKMETALGGVLVDEQQRELSELHLEKINQQIKLIQDQMNARGIPSGCDTALRLFR